MNGHDRALEQSGENCGENKTHCVMCRQIFCTTELEYCAGPSCTNLLCRGCRQDLGGCCGEDCLPEIEQEIDNEQRRLNFMDRTGIGRM